MTWLIDYLPQGTLALDASVVINLLGSGEAVALFCGIGHRCLIEQKTLQELLKHPVPGQELPPVIGELRGRGVLEEVRMTDLEYDLFIGLVHSPLGTRLDDGESAALAIAKRCACIALDEKRARRIASQEMPSLTVVSSLKVILTSAYRLKWPHERVQRCVEMSCRHARMGVPKEERELLAQVLSRED